MILKRFKDKESDAVVKFLSENGNAETIRIHGLLRSKSRSGLLSEPGCLVEFVYYSGKNQSGGSLKEGTLIERFEDIKSSYRQSLLLAALLEISHAVSGDESGREIYDLLIRLLYYFSEKSRKGEFQKKEELLLLFIFFTFRLFSILGILGSTESCSGCGGSFEEKSVYWNLPHMEFICGACESRAGEEDIFFLHAVRSACNYKFDTFTKEIFRNTINSAELIRHLSKNIRICLLSLISSLPACEEFFKQNQIEIR